MATKRLWIIFITGLAISLAGAIILFNPTLEFFVSDLVEKLHLPVGVVGTIAMFGDYALFLICALGLITLTIRHIIKRAKPNP